jgi:hypothetical protein
MLRFIFSQAPADSQIIVAAEDVGQGLADGVEVRSYGEQRRQVLREAQFDEVRDRFAPYFQQLIA